MLGRSVKLIFISNADYAPEGALCSVQPGGNGGRGLYVDLSIAQKRDFDQRRSFKVLSRVPWAKSMYRVRLAFGNLG